MKNKKAFTLAEVLIALIIIGVVTVITIPTVMNNTNKQETVSKLRKAYAALSLATNMIIAENGSPKGDGSWLTHIDDTYNIYKKYLNNAKECGNTQNCISEINYKRLKSDTGWNFGTSYRKLILTDGTYVMFNAMNASCTGSDWCGNNFRCLQILVDINGAKKPNKAGRDLFGFILREDGLYPEGCGSNSQQSDCSNLNGGVGCSCKVLQEGEINY